MRQRPNPAAGRVARLGGGVAVVAAVCALAAGCGGGSAADAPTADTQSTGAAQTATSAGTVTGTAGDIGTLEFGMTDEEFATRVEAVQTAIASCMTEAGFEYIPADVETIQEAQAAVRHEPGLTREEYKKRWGYGATTRFDNKVKQIELGEQNISYFEGLSEADQEAYERTLWGDDPDQTFTWAFDEEDFSGTGGCTRKAVEQVFTEEELSEEYTNPKDLLVEADPRVVEADANWVQCMQDAGYDGYLDQDDVIGEYEERLDELTDGEDPQTLTGERAAALKELQQEEIAVSLVDLDCQIKYLDGPIREVEIELFGHEVSG
jgi:hypothetical protein